MTGTASRQMPILEQLSKGSCLTTRELTAATRLDRRAVADACCKLITRGLIERREIGSFVISAEGKKAVESGVVLTSGPNGDLSQTAPRLNRKEPKRDVIWRAIRIAQKFSIAKIEMLAQARHENTRRYILALERAGILVRLRPEPGSAPTSNGFARYALVRDPGPLAPVWRPRLGEVFDRNSGETYRVRP